MLIALCLALAGCATPGREGRTDRDDRYLAVIQLQKAASPETRDCPFSIRIRNRIPSMQWDGVSYHVSLSGKNGKTVGKLIGAPRSATKPGQDLKDNGKALNARCGEITGASLVYFGYYPQGRKQVNLHNNQVKVTLK